MNQVVKLNPTTISLKDFLVLGTKRNMKKISILLLALLLSVGTFGQSRKYMAQFSHMQGYFNPALTAYEGTMVKGLVRNQWAGWEGAPKMNFISAELDLANLGGSSDLGKNALGVNLLSDEYGAFTESDLILSYATRIQVSEKAGLRMGAGLNINSIRLDGTRLTTSKQMILPWHNMWVDFQT